MGHVEWREPPNISPTFTAKDRSLFTLQLAQAHRIYEAWKREWRPESAHQEWGLYPRIQDWIKTPTGAKFAWLTRYQETTGVGGFLNKAVPLAVFGGAAVSFAAPLIAGSGTATASTGATLKTAAGTGLKFSAGGALKVVGGTIVSAVGTGAAAVGLVDQVKGLVSPTKEPRMAVDSAPQSTFAEDFKRTLLSPPGLYALGVIAVCSFLLLRERK